MAAQVEQPQAPTEVQTEQVQVEHTQEPLVSWTRIMWRDGADIGRLLIILMTMPIRTLPSLA